MDRKDAPAAQGLRSGETSPRIVTWCEYPPIPDRRFDWGAYYEGHLENGPYGWGKTEAEAAQDLIDNYDAPGEQ